MGGSSSIDLFSRPGARWRSNRRTRLRAILKEFFRILQEDGLGVAVRRIWWELTQNVWFDLRHGTDTLMMVPLEDYPDSHTALAYAVRYQPSYSNVIRKCLAEIPGNLLSRPFIDLGCGKGKPLLIAAQCGFLNLVGIDLHADLLNTCKQNLERIQHSQSHLELLEMDVHEYSFPSGPSCCFLYNPFEINVLKTVLEKLRKVAEPGKEAYLIYVNNRHEELVLQVAEKLLDIDSPPEMKAAIYRIMAIRGAAA